MAKNKNTVRKDGRIASQVYIGMENGKLWRILQYMNGNIL